MCFLRMIGGPSSSTQNADLPISPTCCLVNAPALSRVRPCCYPQSSWWHGAIACVEPPTLDTRTSTKIEENCNAGGSFNKRCLFSLAVFSYSYIPLHIPFPASYFPSSHIHPPSDQRYFHGSHTVILQTTWISLADMDMKIFARGRVGAVGT